MSWTRINVFQRLARQWDQLHPYNAAQVLKIQGAPHPDALRLAWHDAMDGLGLGRVHLDGGSYRYECLNGEMSHWGVRLLPPHTDLDGYISEQLNRRFDNPAEPPFRPFAIPGDGHYHLGVVYHHWVADSVSIRTLLREWFVRMYDPRAARHGPVALARAGYGKFFTLMRGGAAMGHGLLTAARWCSAIRHARRLDVRNGIDLSVRFAMRKAPDGWLRHAQSLARKRDVRLNDLFLAAIARLCDEHVPLKPRPRRSGLALGSIVDLRPYAGRDLEDAFGLFLGFTNVLCRRPELRDPELLLRCIARQSAQQKRRGIPQASALRTLAGVTVGHVLRQDYMPRFYQKHLPLAGGISNVNMNRSWATAYHPAPLMEYIRVSPTGPMMPIVFATTTLGDDFHIALTYRPSIVKDDRIDAMSESFWAFPRQLA